MHSHTIGFVGGGGITTIFLEALGGRGLALERVTVSDTSAEVLIGLKLRFPAIATTSDNAEAASQERVFLALHPPTLKTVLPAIASRSEGTRSPSRSRSSSASLSSSSCSPASAASHGSCPTLLRSCARASTRWPSARASPQPSDSRSRRCSTGWGCIP